MTEITFRLTDSSAGDVYAALQSVPWENTHEIIIREHEKSRSLEQNALWHRMIGILAKQMGYTPLEMKCIVKYALGYYHSVQGKTDTLIIYDETHKMKVPDLITLIDQTIIWAGEKGSVL